MLGLSITLNLPSLFTFNSTLTLVALVKSVSCTLLEYKPCLEYSIWLCTTSEVTTTIYKSPSSALKPAPSVKLYNLEFV